MKRLFIILLAATVNCVLIAQSVLAQEERKTKFSAGADLYSSYIWRGSKFGTGPAIQPTVKFAAGGLTVGVWGSFDASGYQEADPYISYSFPFGLSLGITDYYYPGLGGSFFADSSNAYELNGGFTKGGFSISANYIINKAPLPASAGSDKYFQASYAFSQVSVTVGAGDGWHTADGKFNVCNVAIGTSKEISITDRFSIPVSGQIVLNPDKKQLFLAVGFSF
jgi:hypothetical protein